MTGIRQPAQSTASSTAPPSVPRVRPASRRRAGAIGAAVLATAAVWLVADALGADFVLTDSTGTATISLPVTAVFTLVFGLLGWGALAALERWTRHAPRTWRWLAAAVTLLSLIPLLAEHATGGTKAALALIHLTVAAVLVPALPRTTARR
ncbi:DUF6069 family protein [Streptacidiphilus sp. N1-3]|uniref:DUF6069 family protein n=1 Tax=Streptacidiphilus alkalitolerans TaxID=3342712 RepID=A0ABV6WWP3_9ACTN